MNVEANVLDYKVVTSKQGDPMIALRFICADGKSRDWFGSMHTEGSQAITFKSLIVLGFTGADPLELAAGVESGLLDVTKTVSLVVEDETYNGKTREKVRWINEVGGGGFKNVIEKDQVKQFAGMNLKAAFAAQKAILPKPAPKAQDDEDVPF